MNSLTHYAKFVVQVVVTGLTVLVASMVDDRIDATEWRNAGIAALGAVAVLGAGNLPAGVWRYTKTIVAAASAVMVAWQSAAFDGMTQGEWWQLVIVAAGALGVFAAPGPLVRRLPVAANDKPVV